MKSKIKKGESVFKSKLKKGDSVIVIAGKDKGKSGLIKSVGNSKVIIEGINMQVKHTKKTKEKAGEKINLEFPMDVSNVAIKDGSGKPSRIGFKIVNDKKVRIYKTTGSEIK